MSPRLISGRSSMMIPKAADTSCATRINSHCWPPAAFLLWPPINPISSPLPTAMGLGNVATPGTDFAREVRRNKLPAGVIEIDDKWEDGYGSLRFDSSKFTRPKLMNAELHRFW